MRPKSYAMVKEHTLARSLAPEDIKVGTFVMILQQQQQIMMGKCSATGEPEVAIVPVTTRPCWTQLPAKVIAVCLPFVVVQRPETKTEIIDTRSDRLAQVPKSFAMAAIKPHMPKKDKKDKKNKKKQKG